MILSRDSWQEIFHTIGKNKLRTVLSGFSVALSIFIFVALFGFGNGLKNTFTEFFLDDATNTIWIDPGRTSLPYAGLKANREIKFDNRDLANVKAKFERLIAYVTPRIYSFYQVSYNNSSNNYSVRGVAPSHQFAEKTVMMNGRYLNQEDINKRYKYSVIGRLVAKDLFDNESPLGKYIKLGNSMFKVIGIFQDSSGDNEERRVYIPYTTQQLLEKNTNEIDMMIVAFKPQLGHAGALLLENKLKQFLKKQKFISPEDNSGLFFRNVADNFKRNLQFATVLQIIITLVVLGTMLAGIIGISNIMIFVVKERTKELGIRKALGATPIHITLIILQESVFITTVSGILGLIGGFLLLENIGKSLDDYFIKNPYIDVGLAFVSVVMLVIAGSLAGFVPARRAARIRPIESLKNE